MVIAPQLTFIVEEHTQNFVQIVTSSFLLFFDIFDIWKQNPFYAFVIALQDILQ